MERVETIITMLEAERSRIDKAIAVLRPSAMLDARAILPPPAKQKRVRSFTPEQKQEQAERMKAFWAARRKAKVAPKKTTKRALKKAA